LFWSDQEKYEPMLPAVFCRRLLVSEFIKHDKFNNPGNKLNLISIPFLNKARVQNRLSYYQKKTGRVTRFFA
jgi:hypothetical protein